MSAKPLLRNASLDLLMTHLLAWAYYYPPLPPKKNQGVWANRSGVEWLGEQLTVFAMVEKNRRLE